MEKRIKTQQRILEAALSCFTQKGFVGTTIEEICQQAQANIAAVNYYYRDKFHLYQKVWEYAFECAERTFPLICIDQNVEPEEKLRFFIFHFLLQIFSDTPAGAIPKLIFHELSSPSPLLPELLERYMLSRKKILHNVLIEIFQKLGIEKELCPHLIDLVHYSIISQIVMINIHQRFYHILLLSDPDILNRLQKVMDSNNLVKCLGMRGHFSEQERETFCKTLTEHIVQMVIVYLRNLNLQERDRE